MLGRDFIETTRLTIDNIESLLDHATQIPFEMTIGMHIASSQGETALNRQIERGEGLT